MHIGAYAALAIECRASALARPLGLNARIGACPSRFCLFLLIHQGEISRAHRAHGMPHERKDGTPDDRPKFQRRMPFMIWPIGNLNGFYGLGRET
jgi:hypothetical protein